MSRLVKLEKVRVVNQVTMITHTRGSLLIYRMFHNSECIICTTLTSLRFMPEGSIQSDMSTCAVCEQCLDNDHHSDDILVALRSLLVCASGT